MSLWKAAGPGVRYFTIQSGGDILAFVELGRLRVRMRDLGGFWEAHFFGTDISHADVLERPLYAATVLLGLCVTAHWPEHVQLVEFMEDQS